MKSLAGLLLGFASFSPGDNDRHVVIDAASDLVYWCKSEVESRYVAKGITTYQWTSSYYDRGNVMHVDGRIRVHGDDVSVRCRLARGAKVMYMVTEIDDPGL